MKFFLRDLSSGLIFPVAQSIKNLPARQETQIQFLGQEDLLKKEMATHSSILALENPNGQISLAG